MVDKIVDAINQILGGEAPAEPDQKQTSGGTGSGFVPADSTEVKTQSHTAKERNLNQLVSDAKKQLGDKPQ